MSIGTRLVLILTLVVGALMATASFLVLRSREAALHEAARDEVRAHAETLRIALEESFAAGRAPDAQHLINRLGENRMIHGVVLFDESGRVVIVSDDLVAEEVRHPPELSKVINARAPVEFETVIGGAEVFSIIMPLKRGGQFYGAFEIAQPIAFVQADVRRTRRNFAIITLLLVVTIFLVARLVLRRSLQQPVTELLNGAMAVGRGDLAYRVIVPRAGGEFAMLAREFNRMADSLSEQRRRAALEAEERLRLERELRHSERLAAVGRLAAGVAHEMGAPLNVIDARAEQLLNRPDATRDTRERNLQLIRRQTARITHIVRQLLNLARPYDLRRSSVDVRAAVDEALEGIESSISSAGVEVTVSAKEGKRIIVDADADFLRQVLTNILINAVQAMPSGGRLIIDCHGDARVRASLRFASVRISDTGEGIAPENLSHIFDPFFTTKETGSGTGLGLAVARRIVEEHGGWIEVMNNTGGGACFTIYLPQPVEETELAGALPESKVKRNGEMIA